MEKIYQLEAKSPSHLAETQSMCSIKKVERIWNSFREKQTKKEIIPYPICSVVAVFKMLIRILNTLRSRIWDMVFFLFSSVSPNESNSNYLVIFLKSEICFSSYRNDKIILMGKIAGRIRRLYEEKE